MMVLSESKEKEAIQKDQKEIAHAHFQNVPQIKKNESIHQQIETSKNPLEKK